MKKQTTITETSADRIDLSRRTALSRLGLAVSAAYAAPLLITLSKPAHASDAVAAVVVEVVRVMAVARVVEARVPVAEAVRMVEVVARALMAEATERAEAVAQVVRA